MSQITTHILDTSLGKPAANVTVALYQENGDSWNELAISTTNHDGRVGDWLGNQVLPKGHYKLRFLTADYFAMNNIEGFYPWVEIAFIIAGDRQHYHVPLLLNPFGYSTYRGS